MSILADGKNYFGAENFPVTVITAPETEESEFDLTTVKHRHDFTELVIISSGKANHWVEGMSYPVSAGDVFLFQGNQEHYFMDCEDIVIYNVMFDPERLTLPMEMFRKIPGYHAFFILEPNYRRKHSFKSRLHLDRASLARLEDIAKRIKKESERAFPGYEAAMTALLSELIVFVAREYSNTKSSEGRALLRVGELIGALEQNYRKKWSLSDLAKKACMSKSNLLKVFAEATGQSPIDYLISIRIQKAMALLRDTDLKVSEIAFETGFSDSNYFSRIFRKVTSLSPLEYRKRT